MNTITKLPQPARLILAVLLNLAYMLTVQADTLRDPTQPPASLNSESGTEQVMTSGPVLQSVMIGSQIRAAIINGEKIQLGKKYQQATLIKLNEHEAVLRNPDMSTQTLVINYAIEKKVLSPVVTSSTKKTK
jgi:MSHA biogenesis protein MshK